MNIIITLKSVNKGIFNLKIKRETGQIEYKSIEHEKVFDFIQSYETFAEVNGFRMLFIVPDTIKKMCAEWIGNLAKQYNK